LVLLISVRQCSNVK